ncbi:ATP-binding protein [Nostoc sp. 'Peltigera membranacea cyanobiont' 210A]|uniref:AAA family ATPase n=1 Tax=Nostoc sp. 'Peltigera membranacea cyanobiont' 210A TaxID=2014529 RepID=UPI000B952FC9|nr:ATP-binding protein [Nostoc sp. 'Peltigera membranacea cyanobiont' 210A]OYD91881.1 ATP-binding protein [Nostoc sp. 'Peltigera membranacea cyanobiont' 210A]
MKPIIENPINIPRYPLEFQQIITAKNQNFVGREFVFAAINKFLNQSDRGYFTIIGDPGIGKSAILAHYVSQNPGVVYYNVEITGKNRVEEFLTTICTQLIEIAQNQGIKNLTANFPDSTTEDSGFLSLLLQQISNRLQPKQRLIITIDGCDRIDINNQPRGSNIFYLPRYLPEKVYFILSRRPFLADKSGLLIETPAQSLDLSNYPEQNRADIQKYIKTYLNELSHSVEASAATHRVRSLSEKKNPGGVLLKMTQGFDDETNFMYVKEILAAINEDIYPQNLQIYYQNHLEKMNLATRKQQPMALQVLNILVQEQSISIEAIAERLDTDEYEIKVILDKWREFLHLESIAAEIHYSIYHANFRDWLRQRIESKV